MTLAYLPAEDGLLHCAAAQRLAKAPSQNWKRGFDLRWSQGDSNP